MKALWSKDILAHMIADGCIVNRATVFGPGSGMMQLELRRLAGKHDGKEPFPGLTAQTAELLQSGKVIGILNLVADKQSYLLDVVIQEDESTHEEEAKP